jgi:hypothetical protein
MTLNGKRDISEYLIYIPVHISISIYTTPTNVRYQQLNPRGGIQSLEQWAEGEGGGL